MAVAGAFVFHKHIFSFSANFQFVGKKAQSISRPKTNTADDKRPVSRIQDRELQEMSDEGMCMSMHQPWASLLVCGIKM